MIQYPRASTIEGLPSDLVERAELSSLFEQKFNESSRVIDVPVNKLPLRVREKPDEYSFEAQVFHRGTTIPICFEDAQLSPLQKVALELIEKDHKKFPPHSFLTPEVQLNVANKFREYIDAIHNFYTSIKTAMKEVSGESIVQLKTQELLDLKFDAYLAKLFLEHKYDFLAEKSIEQCCNFKVEDLETQGDIYSDVMLALLKITLDNSALSQFQSREVSKKILSAMIANQHRESNPFSISEAYCKAMIPIVHGLLSAKDEQTLDQIRANLLNPQEFKYVLGKAITQLDSQSNALVNKLGKKYLSELYTNNIASEKTYYNSIVIHEYTESFNHKSYFRMGNQEKNNYDYNLLRSFIGFFSKVTEPELAESCLKELPDADNNLAENIKVIAAYSNKLISCSEDQELESKVDLLKQKAVKIIKRSKDADLAYAGNLYHQLSPKDEDFHLVIQGVIYDDEYQDLELLFRAIYLHKIGNDAQAQNYLNIYQRSEVGTKVDCFRMSAESAYFKQFVSRCMSELQDSQVEKDFKSKFDLHLLSLIKRNKDVLSQSEYHKSLLILAARTGLTKTFDFLEANYLADYEKSSSKIYLEKADIAFQINNQELVDHCLNRASEKLAEMIDSESIYPSQTELFNYLNSASDIFKSAIAYNRIEMSRELALQIIDQYEILLKLFAFQDGQSIKALLKSTNLNKLVIEQLFRY